jgi:hypothetical protein
LDARPCSFTAFSHGVHLALTRVVAFVGLEYPRQAAASIVRTVLTEFMVSKVLLIMMPTIQRIKALVKYVQYDVTRCPSPFSGCGWKEGGVTPLVVSPAYGHTRVASAALRHPCLALVPGVCP